MMTKHLQAASKFGLVLDSLNQTDRAIVVLACHLLKLERDADVAALMLLAKTRPDKMTGVEHLADDELVRLLNCLSEDERQCWVQVITEMISNDDGTRFDRLMELLKMRVTDI